MTTAELRRIRNQSAASQAAFARALGYKDSDAYRKYETGGRPIPTLLQKLAYMIDRHGMPGEWLDCESANTENQGANTARK